MKKSTTREKLLDVAFAEVYTHGYAATPVDTILKKETQCL
jgi:AcrR family transcriptional regulator